MRKQPTVVGRRVENTWRRRWTWPSAVNMHRRPSFVDHTQQPATCIARWAIGHDGVARSISLLADTYSEEEGMTVFTARR